ncbi:hypothetical protein GCM10023175_65280 [Pseudonocardia xishanensis]|uniref:Uncharacterized protein n=1 Tax=Pseudonocardia xishanensis TaxID=630995 RepID=A0ABP8S372_9PSEU
MLKPRAASHFGGGPVALAGDSDHVAAELLRERLGHDDDPSSEERVLTGLKSTEPWASPSLPRPKGM